MNTNVFFDIETLGLESTTDKIVCVSFGYNSKAGFEKEEIITLASTDEKVILELFWKAVSQVENPILISFNGNRFDIPFIIKRSIINNIRCCKFDSIDTMQTANTYPRFSNEPIQRGSLSYWAKVMGIEVKTQNGNMIPTMYYNGDLKGIEAHCKEDLEILIRFWKRLEDCNLLWLVT